MAKYSRGTSSHHLLTFCTNQLYHIDGFLQQSCFGSFLTHLIKSYYYRFIAIKFAKPSWRTPQSMMLFIANPTELVGASPLHLACARPLCRLKAPLGLSLLRKRGLLEKYRTVWVYSPWRFLPPRNTPDSFCRLPHPTKSSLRCVGGIFLFQK